MQALHALVDRAEPPRFSGQPAVGTSAVRFQRAVIPHETVVVAMHQYPAGISLCMIVKDEEHFIDDALRSVAGVVDEICIVDTGSCDRTIDIALAHGARVTCIAWQDDFAQARNAALALATRRWIFVLDADERLDEVCRAQLRAIGQTRARQRGKWIACRNLTDSDNVQGALTNMLVRIFPNDPRIRYRNVVHEFIALDGSDAGLPSDRTEIRIVHHGYLPAVVRERNKGERNLRLARTAAQRDPGDGFHQYNLGMASLLAGDRDGAIAALETMREITRIKPRGYRVHGLAVLAELYAEHRADAHTARTIVHECLALVPNYSNAHFVHGKMLARSGNLFEARDAFGRAIAAGAHNAEQFVVDDEIAIWKAHSEIGATLMREARYGEALAWFELACAARPTARPLVINRAKCHEALGHSVVAGELYASAFAAGIDEASAIEYINFLFRADRPAQAFGVIDRAEPVVSAECRVLLLGTAAAAALRAGDLARAQQYVDRALSGEDPAAARALLAALAGHVGLPRLLDLMAPATIGRAKPLRIAYAIA